MMKFKSFWISVLNNLLIKNKSDNYDHILIKFKNWSLKKTCKKFDDPKQFKE